MKGTILKKVSKRSYLAKAASGQVYRRNPKILCQTKERLTELNMAGEDSTEDELVIPFTEQQQMQDNEQTPANQNNHSEHTFTRFGRVCNPPNSFKDYIRHSQLLFIILNFVDI